MDSLTSRFFTMEDRKIKKLIYPLPESWWSRCYEYAWAMGFCDKKDTVLDAACGIEHPFKLYLSTQCKETWAVDKDRAILSDKKIRKTIQKKLGVSYVNLKSFNFNVFCADITELPFPNAKFDKVFCLSVLEHLPEGDMVKALQEFYRVLKKNGFLILTVDYPNVSFEKLEGFVKNMGFIFAGKANHKLPPNVIYSKVWKRNCFRIVLKKL